MSGWAERIFLNTNCAATLPAGATQLYPSTGVSAISVAAGDSVCIVVREFIPATATNNNKNVVDVRAAFDLLGANPALTSSLGVIDVTSVGDAALQLTKEVRNVTQSVMTFNLINQAKSGDILEYRLSYINNATTSVRDLTINDTVPAYSTFVSTGLETTPSTLTTCMKSTPANPLPGTEVDCASLQTGGGSGAMRWRFTGALDPSGRGSILFRVKVD